MYHPSRDNTQIVGRDLNRCRDHGVRLRKANLNSEVLCLGTLLPTQPKSWREEPAIGSRWNGTQYSIRSFHVACDRDRHRPQRLDSSSMSVIEIFRQLQFTGGQVVVRPNMPEKPDAAISHADTPGS